MDGRESLAEKGVERHDVHSQTLRQGSRPHAGAHPYHVPNLMLPRDRGRGAGRRSARATMASASANWTAALVIVALILLNLSFAGESQPFLGPINAHLGLPAL